ncbi:bifunctional adenosylcobinamide kinase/adenosylcobinamide-phosphate guanylyltransferase [Sporosarcina sp. G11-34]|uniref:bifunctional adenosylcobinamide kinase/adenosylcobinamide-phosphate guanylyltransferase n=1 Tax=Sporosarcina sp. G11-34 TaxID=2849605 RepID=UPI0022A95B1E|nr:bifunctional adenosylcobinamide kinase/adenosylcobinamide-phosphate guanylyltransferase [Sporosarcina sp. G11-34]MCZ2257498.1 bifunctional adenosylcobinamide kinase/adenosylcobinamide-phosphate guanylyltransferase [Sporosarcina sp. G11-34]
MVRGKLTFISGGVRSGKSAYAEQLLVTQNKGRLIYIASGSATDSEMSDRIQRHRHDRSEFNWTTIEQPMNLEEVIPFIKQGDFVLWDCVTTWLAHELYNDEKTAMTAIEKTESRLYETIEELLTIATHLVIVSNELFDELPSHYEKVRLYSQILGRIHTKLVEKSNTAIEMDYGIATFWKQGDAQ